MAETAIIGSGFSGCAAAHGLRKLGHTATVYEKADGWGGHTRAVETDGFWFDEGPHLSFTTDERVKAVFAEGAKNGIEELSARITNYFQGVWLTHPAQVHLHGLPADLITEIISSFVTTQQDPPAIETYADWLVAMYGKKFAEEFPFRYTRKYWTVEPSAMGTDWVGKRMYPPKLEEVVRGALAPDNEGDFHYLKSYRYPSEGGYQSFMKALVEGVDIQVNKKVAGVDPSKKQLRFEDGATVSYDSLISSMPLDMLVASLEGITVPQEVTDASQRLLCTSVVLVDIAVDRADLFTHEWFYVYDEDISFSRVHFPHMLAPSMAPEGKGSVQAEVYFSREKPLETPVEQLADRVIDEFIQMGILRNRDEVVFSRCRPLQYANIVFDHHRQPALDIIKPYIADLGIDLIGRFGEWDYHWTDNATIAGWRAAAALGGVEIDEMLAR